MDHRVRQGQQVALVQPVELDQPEFQEFREQQAALVRLEVQDQQD